MFRILFVCTANLYRSPLAAAFLLKRLQAEGVTGRWRVASAGTWTVPDQRVPAHALAAAQAMGLDLSGHVTRQVDGELLSKFDLIIVMEKGHREALQIEFPFLQDRVHLLSELADHMAYNISDPARPHQEIQTVLVEMSRLIDRAYPEICRLAGPDEMTPPPRKHNVNVTL